MSRSRAFDTVLAVLCASLISSTVHALANRVFVSARSGNDANSCDNINTPCQTFAGAVLQLNPGGEAIVLDSGGYGPVTITQAVTIEAPPGVTAFIHPPSGDGVTINADTSDAVVLRGLVLNVGTNNGITVNTVGTLTVENCLISGFTNFGIQMAGAGVLSLKNTDVKGCFIGLEIQNSSGTVRASLDHCHLDGNAAGFRSETVSPGVSKTTATNTTANNNEQTGWISGNSSSGTEILNLEFCSASGNGIGRGVLGFSTNVASRVRYSNCIFANNGTYGVDQVGSTVESRGNNTITGNGTAPTHGTIGSFLPM